MKKGFTTLNISRRMSSFLWPFSMKFVTPRGGTDSGTVERKGIQLWESLLAL